MPKLCCAVHLPNACTCSHSRSPLGRAVSSMSAVARLLSPFTAACTMSTMFPITSLPMPPALPALSGLGVASGEGTKPCDTLRRAADSSKSQETAECSMLRMHMRWHSLGLHLAASGCCTLHSFCCIVTKFSCCPAPGGAIIPAAAGGACGGGQKPGCCAADCSSGRERGRRARKQERHGGVVVAEENRRKRGEIDFLWPARADESASDEAEPQPPKNQKEDISSFLVKPPCISTQTGCCSAMCSWVRRPGGCCRPLSGSVLRTPRAAARRAQ